MSSPMDRKKSEQRRQPRVTIPEHPQILDAHSGKVLGHLVNLSVDGLMAVSAGFVHRGTLYQVRIPLLIGDKSVEIQLGIESLWCEDANESGSYWTGFHIIDISPDYRNMLQSFVGT